MSKKIFALLLAGVMMLSLAACGSSSSGSSAAASKPAASAAASTSASGEAAGLTEAFAEYPALVTSGGQSADYQMIGLSWASWAWTTPSTIWPPPLIWATPRP